MVCNCFDEGDEVIFERFTDRARRVTVLAQEEARMLNHNYIGTGHILLGLIHEGEGVAAKALEALGISLEGVRSQVEEIIGQGQQAPSGHIDFTPRAKRVLELSLREALQLGHNYIGTEHVLLGLIREGVGVAAQVLVKLGAELTRVRQVVIQILSGYDVLAARRRFDAHLADLDEQIAAQWTVKEEAIDARDYDAAAKARDAQVALQRQRKELADQSMYQPAQESTREQVRSAVSVDVKNIINDVYRVTKVLNGHGVSDPSVELINALIKWKGLTP